MISQPMPDLLAPSTENGRPRPFLFRNETDGDVRSPSTLASIASHTNHGSCA